MVETDRSYHLRRAREERERAERAPHTPAGHVHAALAQLHQDRARELEAGITPLE